MQNDQGAIAIVTCSYGPDAERCIRLCRSIDRYVPESIEHCLIVPARDVPRFAHLHKGRRRVCVTEEVVPGGFRRMPLLKKWWVDSQGWPVRGWIMQQVTKLSANHAVSAPHIIFADSDLVFVRPFDAALFCAGAKVRLHRIPGAESEGEHLLWHRCAGELLGLSPRYFGSDYIGQLISWQRSHLENLQMHLELTQKRPWYRSVARSLRFSEYVLYGVYVEHVLGEAQSGHFFSDQDPCHCCWSPDDAHRLERDPAAINPRSQAVLLQSNLGLDPGQEAELINGVHRLIEPAMPTGH